MPMIEMNDIGHRRLRAGLSGLIEAPVRRLCSEIELLYFAPKVAKLSGLPPTGSANPGNLNKDLT